MYSISLATSLNPYLTFDSTPRDWEVGQFNTSVELQLSKLSLMNDSDPRRCSGFGGFSASGTPWPSVAPILVAYTMPCLAEK